MKLFQISDLHLDGSIDLNEYKTMLKKMAEVIIKESDNSNIVYIICCGDIVNKGNNFGYSTSAKYVFDYLKSEIKNKDIDFLFVPGNHDLCNSDFSAFCEFITDYNTRLDFCHNNVILYNTPKLDFLLINSEFHKDIKYGNIDLKQVSTQLEKAKNPVIIVMHHTLMSRYAEDRSPLSNAYGLLDQIENNNVIGVLHGHTHGFSNILIGSNCRIVGVGSLFKYIPNCNNQFNVIEISQRCIETVTNYRYHFDLDSFNQVLLYKNQMNSYFDGKKISEIYCKIMDAVQYHNGINNLYLQLSTDLQSYMSDMTSCFVEDIKLAKLWLKETTPSTLYYNHGAYMVDNGIHGIDYIIDELSHNSTSNRAIIPLFRFKDVLDHRYDYLPGLNCIQFGFLNDKKTTLYCSVYLRSLEVSRFLRINLSEIYLLVCKIYEKIRSISNLCITLYALKAQIKNNFSCFKKAQVDVATPGDLAHIIYSKDKNKLLKLLRDKFEMQETVINTSGLSALYDVMEKSEIVNKCWLDGLLEIIDDMHILNEEYHKNSDYYTIAPMEEKMHKSQINYLNLIEQELN